MHRSKIAADATEFAVQLLRDQIGQKVYPVHRLDRKTSGVLLFAKTPEANSELAILFQERKIKKTYIAIVRGWLKEKEGLIDYALKNDGKTQDAQTYFKAIREFEIPLPHGQFLTSRYSLLELRPRTGRFHQIRKHLAHIRHPILGDRPHGCNKQNRLWKEKFGLTKMMLHAKELSFNYKKEINIQAKLQEIFRQTLNSLIENNRLPLE